jgi:hypothetical protein
MSDWLKGFVNGSGSILVGVAITTGDYEFAVAFFVIAVLVQFIGVRK